MDTESLDHFFNSFPLTAKEDWLTAAKLELDGADPFQKLTHENYGLTILPYYDKTDLSTGRFQLKVATQEFLGPRAWHNMPLIVVTNAAESNKRALAELNCGADGICFNITNSNTDVHVLLDKIEWPYCSINFQGNISDQFLNSLHGNIAERKFDVTTLTGCIFRNESVENDLVSSKLFESWSNFHPIGVNVADGKSPAEEIASALALAVNQIDFLTDTGWSSKRALEAHAFHVPVGEDIFVSIAKLKVLRTLWSTVSLQYGTKTHVNTFIHATTVPRIKKEYQPGGNLIKSTSAAFSAILGGCDGLTVVPEDTDNATMARVATNVSSILREESHLSRVADPTAGSYYLESLIDQLATQSWLSFQKKVNP